MISGGWCKRSLQEDSVSLTYVQVINFLIFKSNTSKIASCIISIPGVSPNPELAICIVGEPEMKRVISYIDLQYELITLTSLSPRSGGHPCNSFAFYLCLLSNKVHKTVVKKQMVDYAKHFKFLVVLLQWTFARHRLSTCFVLTWMRSGVSSSCLQNQKKYQWVS